MAKRLVPDYPSPPALPEAKPRSVRRAWGKVPYEDRFRQQRRDLLDAAASLAAEDGIAETTIASIATNAGVAKRVFYEHFTDKETCFVEVMRQLSASQISHAAKIAESANGSAIETIRSVIGALVTPRKDVDPRLFAAIRAEARPDSRMADAYAEHHRQIAELLVVVALRLGSKLQRRTLRLAALILVNGVVDLGPDLRRRRGVLDELSTIVCVTFGLG